MADKKHPGSSRPSTAPGAASGSTDSKHDENPFAVDVERLSSSNISLELATTHDIESQTEFAGAAGKEMQLSRDGSSTTDGSNGSHETITTVGSPAASKWRWIGQKDLQYLVTNRRTPPPRPEGVASAIELKDGNDPDSSSSAGAQTAAAGDSLEKGAFVRVVTEGAGIPASLEVGNEGGRQRIAHILLPTEADSPERNQLDNPDHLHPVSQLSRQELSVVTTAPAAPAAAAGGKKRKVSSVVPDRNSLSLIQDLEKGKVCDEARIRRGEDAPSGYYHQQGDDNEPLCRVCQQPSGKADVINLGCACKLDLGRAHKGCAETWFQVRGNRQCEICGKIAQNVQLLEPMNDTPTTIENPPETVITVVNVHHPASICLQNRPLRNFLLVFLVAAFLVPWLFRFAYYRS